MSERNEKRIINAVFAILAIVIIVFAVDIEIKLSKLMDSEPMVVNTHPETSESATVDIYSFHNELSADNTTTAAVVASQNIAGSSYPSTIIVNETTASNADETEVQITTQYINPSAETTVPSTVPTTAAVPSTIWSVDADQNFYRTKSGNKYHKADCSYLKNSRILVSVDEIISEGYEPCSKCMKGE